MNDLVKGVKDTLAILVEVLAGLVAGIMILGLVPGDEIEVDTVGALVVAALAGTVSYLAARYRKSLHA